MPGYHHKSRMRSGIKILEEMIDRDHSTLDTLLSTFLPFLDKILGQSQLPVNKSTKCLLAVILLGFLWGRLSPILPTLNKKRMIDEFKKRAGAYWRVYAKALPRPKTGVDWMRRQVFST